MEASSSEGESSSSNAGGNPLFAGWNIARWALGSGVRPPAAVVPPRPLPPPAPQPIAAASAAAQAAASLAAWEEAEERPAARGLGGFGAFGPAAQQQQQQRQVYGGGLGVAGGGAAYVEEEEGFYEEEEEETEWDTYRPFKLLLAGGERRRSRCRLHDGAGLRHAARCLPSIASTSNCNHSCPSISMQCSACSSYLLQMAGMHHRCAPCCCTHLLADPSTCPSACCRCVQALRGQSAEQPPRRWTG